MGRMGFRAMLVGAALASCTESGTSCFVAGTRVRTPRGRRPIDSLAPGDAVWSYIPSHGLVERCVERVHRSMVRVVCRLELGDLTVRGVTPSHPMYDASLGDYIALRDLRRDSRLLVFGEPGIREMLIDDLIIHEVHEPTLEVFNLTVAGPEHNYIADDVLVHNKKYGTPDGSIGSTSAGSTSTTGTINLDGSGGSGASLGTGGNGGGGGTDSGTSGGGAGAPSEAGAAGEGGAR